MHQWQTPTEISRVLPDACNEYAKAGPEKKDALFVASCLNGKTILGHEDIKDQ